MITFDSVQEGVEALREYAQNTNRTVFALLSFQATNRKMVKECFLFRSEGDEASQLIKNFPGHFRLQGFQHNEMPDALAARNVALQAELQNPVGLGLRPEGHAEEFLIESFNTCLALTHESVRNVTIYVSQSPCTPQDGNASDNLPQWPVSCTRKLALLAAQNTGYQFTICFFRRFGVNSNNDTIEDHLNQLAGNLRNLAFVWLQ